MSENKKTKKIKIGGMTCVSCENRIEKKLNQTIGIYDVKLSYRNGTGEITYDSDTILFDAIIHLIEELGYTVIQNEQQSNQDSGITKLLGAVVILFGIYVFMKRFGLTNIFHIFPQAEEGMGYGMLFLTGLLTSVHCIAMCGGINLSQCIPQTVKENSRQGKWESLRPGMLYNAGRIISYTVIGGLVGALGSVLSFSGSAKGIVQLAAGVFMVIMGLNMLNMFPWLRKINPRLPKVFARKIYTEKKSNSPFYVGLLNGLMPCGPLQAMQLYALSTGDPIKGAMSMMLFSLGTVPFMFGLGVLSSILSQKFTKKVMSAGAVLVVLLGISMFHNGLSLSGISLAAPLSEANEKDNSNLAEIQDGVQIVNTTLNPGRYEPITVQAGIPVKWTITAEGGSINGCNNRILVQEYNIEKSLEVGENVIEFTPNETGIFHYSCWMGMIRSTINVYNKGE